jgi:hypothetical protein
MTYGEQRENSMNVTAEGLKKLTIVEIAEVIAQTWPKIDPYARPYLEAMFLIEDIHDQYFCDPAYEIVMYFLSNAGTYRGEAARLVKAELKLRSKAYEKANKMKR